MEATYENRHNAFGRPSPSSRFNAESLDERSADQNFFDDLINKNYFWGIEASHPHRETTGDNGSNADFT